MPLCSPCSTCDALLCLEQQSGKSITMKTIPITEATSRIAEMQSDNDFDELDTLPEDEVKFFAESITSQTEIGMDPPDYAIQGIINAMNKINQTKRKANAMLKGFGLPKSVISDITSKIQTKQDAKPTVLIPQGVQTISSCGEQLGKLLAKKQIMYNRGGVVVKIIKDDEDLPMISEVKPVTLSSDFESVATIYKVDTHGAEVPAVFTEAASRLVANSDSFKAQLPKLKIIAPCPVLTEHNGKLVEVHGYDPQTGIYARGDRPEEISLDDAKAMLLDAVSGFQFADEADRSRAIASIITPALVFGGLLKGRAPIDLSEANDSQTGKGFKSRIVTEIYGQSAKVVTQGDKGVGSLEEKFSTHLINGALFILFDNVRGRVDSQAFESFLTEDHFTARAAYKQATDIDPRRVCILMTSNKADLTKDLANRCSCVRILKHKEGHLFKLYTEGDILDHIKANQSKYLGAVFAIIRHWHSLGCPKSAESGHDFRAWAQTLGWITSNIFGLKPMMEGHRDTQERMTNPALSWLRELAIEIVRIGKTETFCRTSDIIDMLSETQIEIPGMRDHDDISDEVIRKKALQTVGRRMGQCFRKGDKIVIDGMVIERRDSYVPSIGKNTKEYAFFAPEIAETAIGGIIGGNDENHAPKTKCENLHEPEKNTIPPMESKIPPIAPPMSSPIKSLIPPIPPIASEQITLISFEEAKNRYIKHSMGVIGGIGGKSTQKQHQEMTEDEELFDLAQ
jgi:hypothetical protein